MSLPIVLVGAGGHANVAFDILSSNGCRVEGFIDPVVDSFFNLTKYTDTDFNNSALAMGLGGVEPHKLSARLNLFNSYKSKGANFINIISNNACISKLASVGEGVFISHGAIVNGPSKIGDLVIINTQAVIEHDVIIEDGAHIAPGAILLGNCHIGKNSMVGSGAVILPGYKVPDNSLVPALTRYSKNHD